MRAVCEGPLYRNQQVLVQLTCVARRWEAAGAPHQGYMPGEPAGSLRDVILEFEV